MGEKQELGPNQRKWVEALRSGQYEQGKRVLCNRSGMHCCLGVACRLFLGEPAAQDNNGDFVWGVSRDGGLAPSELQQLIGLRDEFGSAREDEEPALYQLNDDGKTFAEIADLLESDPANWFTEAR